MWLRCIRNILCCPVTPPLPFTADELLEAFAWWLEHGGDPGLVLARLHLPRTYRRVLNHLRDRQLVAAAQMVAPHGASYAQAVALRHACREFGGSLWPAWQRLPAPPEYAKPAAQILFWAFRFDQGNTRDNRPHTPADWSLSAFRKLLPNSEKECRSAA